MRAGTASVFIDPLHGHHDRCAPPSRLVCLPPRLCRRGRPRKAALVTAVRTLLLILNAVLRDRALRQLPQRPRRMRFDFSTIVRATAFYFDKSLSRWFGLYLSRFHCYFNPSCSAWLNPVEQWSGALQRYVPVQGSFADVAVLRAILGCYVRDCNLHAAPSQWNVSANDLRDRIAHIRTAYEMLHQTPKPQFECDAPADLLKRSTLPNSCDRMVDCL